MVNSNPSWCDVFWPFLFWRVFPLFSFQDVCKTRIGMRQCQCLQEIPKSFVLICIYFLKKNVRHAILKILNQFWVGIFFLWIEIVSGTFRSAWGGSFVFGLSLSGVFFSSSKESPLCVLPAMYSSIEDPISRGSTWTSSFHVTKEILRLGRGLLALRLLNPLKNPTISDFLRQTSVADVRHSFDDRIDCRSWFEQVTPAPYCRGWQFCGRLLLLSRTFGFSVCLKNELKNGTWTEI